MQFYSYVTETPDAPGMTDEPVGSGGRSIDRDLRTELSIDVLPDRTLEILTAAEAAPAEEPTEEEAPAAEAAAPAAEEGDKGKKGKKAKV